MDFIVEPGEPKKGEEVKNVLVNSKMEEVVDIKTHQKLRDRAVKNNSKKLIKQFRTEINRLMRKLSKEHVRGKED